MANLGPMAFVLLLGSYDSQTKEYLDDIKGTIEMNFSGEYLSSFMLEDVELYFSEQLQVIAELTHNGKATLFIFRHHQELEDVFDVDLKGDLDDTVYHFLKKKYGVTLKTKESVFQKFDFMMRAAKTLLLIRDREETRGGEYVELMYAISKGHANKVWFLRRDGVRLSSMLMEYLDKAKVNMRPYIDYSDLKGEIVRLLRCSVLS